MTFERYIELHTRLSYCYGALDDELWSPKGDLTVVAKLHNRIKLYQEELSIEHRKMYNDDNEGKF